MSNINPENYQGATVVIVGSAGGPAKAPAYDKDGTSGVLELSVAVGQGYKKDGAWVDTGTTWYTYKAAGSYADNLRGIGKGDKVRIDEAKLETREFTRKDESIGQQFLLSYGSIEVLESKSGAGPAAPTASDDSPF